MMAQTLAPDDVLAYLRGYPERFKPIGQSKYIAGFETADGRHLAVSLDLKAAKLWAEPGVWFDAVRDRLKDIVEYSAGQVRSSNLAANAPNVGPSHAALYFSVPTLAALTVVCDAYSDNYSMETISMPEHSTPDQAAEVALNQILYGPPGTGKTFATIDESLRILDPAYLRAHESDRAKLKTRFDELVAAEQIRFVTFHQSFSYEDFVEGLRPELGDDKQLNYVVAPGVFKKLCIDALTVGTLKEQGVNSDSAVWKVSIAGSGANPTKSYCLEQGEARIGWGATGDLQQAHNDYWNSLGWKNQGTLEYFSNDMNVGDIVLCLHSADLIAAIGVVTGPYKYELQVPGGVIPDYQHVRPVRWLFTDLNLPIAPLNDGKGFTQRTVYRMGRVTWGDVVAYLERNNVSASLQVKNYVMIIDEINRGNVSRIFGELITLIEPSKRAGAEESLTIRLPYSKREFSVPANVYLLGTMNTADRSLAGLDVALRRRFAFRELPPRPDLLADVTVAGVNIGATLQIMNERIAVLLDRDHCIGHAYFMPLMGKDDLVKLGFIFQQQIIPLLQEYFFEDWERIALILNDPAKPQEFAFVVRDDTDLTKLFGSHTPDGLRDSSRQRWRLNPQAFTKVDSYRLIA